MSSPLSSVPPSPPLSSLLSSPPPASPPHLDAQTTTLDEIQSNEASPPAQPAPEPPISNAPTLTPVHQTPYYAIEYPGYVQPRELSLAHAIHTLGGQKALDRAFSEGGRILELRLQPDNPFAHPVTGDVVGTSKLLVKVVTRRKKQTASGQGVGSSTDTGNSTNSALDKGKGKEVQVDEGATQSAGTYSAEIVGIIPKTVRFRSMADFQYQPDEDDYIVQMRHAMDRLDVDAVHSFDFKPLTENYSGARSPKPSNAANSEQMDVDVDAGLGAAIQSSGSAASEGPKSQLQLIPPPLFTRQGIAQHYNLKQNPMSVIHTTVDARTGEETQRYIHKHRIKGSLAPAAASWESETVPTGPPKHVLDAEAQAKPHLLTRLRDLFSQRPVWSRVALINQLPTLEGREIQNVKVYIGLVAYTFSDGAWRDTLLRLGYDPRKDPQARFYQRVYFRNTANEDSRRKSIVGRRAGGDTTSEAVEAPVNDPNSHIFDGRTLHPGAASFQLCDITDTLLVPMINDERSVREEPDIADGWYTTKEFRLIKAVVRRKHFNLLQGKVISDNDCADLFVSGGLSSSNTVIRNESTSTSKRLLRKSRSKRRPIAPERLMAAELEIALRKERESTNARETSRASESDADGNETVEDAMDETE